MRIVIADACPWDYNPDTAFAKPLGGTHSAASYLAIALAQLGHQIFFITNTSQPGIVRGVNCLAWNASADAEFAALAPDLVVAIQQPALGVRLRRIFGPNARIVAWTGNSYTPLDALTQRLLNDKALWALDGVALVSDWQRRNFVQALSYPPQRTCLLRNAVAPAFENLFPAPQTILPQKTTPAVLAYTTTPFRGLDILARAFPEIRRQVPGVRLKVFSSMRVYLDSTPSSEQAAFGALYRQLQQTEGVEYIGSVPQFELAAQLRTVQVLAYPNTFEETSCITVLEAMACGCQIVTSELGALPETTAGFADLVPAPPRTHQYMTQFIDRTVAALRRAILDPVNTEAHLRRQVDFINEKFTWKQRASEFVSLLGALPRAELSPTTSSTEIRILGSTPTGGRMISFQPKP